LVIARHEVPGNKELSSKSVDVGDHEGVSETGAEAGGEAFAFDEGSRVVGVAVSHPRIGHDLDCADTAA